MDLRLLDSILGRLLRQMAHSQMNIETSKAILTERPNFNPTIAFAELTTKSRLTPNEIMEFCESYGILCSKEDVKHVLDHWDLNKDN